jgi:hypothetical protein
MGVPSVRARKPCACVIPAAQLLFCVSACRCGPGGSAASFLRASDGRSATYPRRIRRRVEDQSTVQRRWQPLLKEKKDGESSGDTQNRHNCVLSSRGAAWRSGPHVQLMPSSQMCSPDSWRNMHRVARKRTAGNEAPEVHRQCDLMLRLLHDGASGLDVQRPCRCPSQPP